MSEVPQELVDKIDYNEMTNKQISFLELLTKNYIGETNKSLKQLALEAGYSQETARQATRAVLGSENIKEANELVKQKLASIRFKAIEALDDQEKLNNTDARGLVQVISKVTETRRLIDDKSTENIQIVNDL